MGTELQSPPQRDAAGTAARHPSGSAARVGAGPEAWSAALLVAPLFAYFLILYWKIFLGYVPLPLDLALYHWPWAAAAPAGWKGGSYILSDIMDQMAPGMGMLRDAIARGDLPVYTDLLQNGVPWLLVSRHEMLSPIVLAPILLVGPAFAYSVTVMLKFLLGGYFFVRLLREWGVGLLAASTGAMAFIASSYAVGNLGHGIGTMYYLTPVMMYGLYRTMSGSWLWTMLMPLAIFTLYASGYPPAMAYHVTLYGAYVLFWMATNPARAWAAMLRLAVAGALAATLMLPSLIETYNYLLKDLDFDYRNNYWAARLPPKSVVSMFAPWAFGDGTTSFNWVRNCVYFGLLPLLAAAASLFLADRRKEYIFFTGFTAYLLLVVFSSTFLYLVYRHIPVLSGSHPSNQIMMLIYTLSMMAAFGIDRIGQAQVTLRRVGIALAGAGLVFLALVLALWPHFAEASPLHLGGAALGLAFAAALLIAWKRTKWGSLSIAIVAFVCLDMAQMGYGYNRTVPTALAYPETPAIAFVKQNIGDGKLLSLETSMLADTPLWHSIATVGGRGFFSADTKKLYQLINKDAFAAHATQYLFPADDTTKLDSPVIDLLDVRYLTANPNVAEGETRQRIEALRLSDGRQRYRLVHSGDLAIFENAGALGRGFLVPNVATATVDEAHEGMSRAGFDPAALAYVDASGLSADETAQLVAQNGQPLDGKVELTQRLSGSLAFAVEASRPALLVVGDNYHPTLAARVNGIAAKVLRTDFTLRGVWVPAGRSEVTIAYAPAHLRWSIPVAAVALLVLAGGVAVAGWPTRRRGRRTASA